MTTPNSADQQAQYIRLVLAILGAALALVGWARWAAL